MCSDHDLAHVECFRISARRHALDPADACERPERFSREPRTTQLRRETAHEGVDLAVMARIMPFERFGHPDELAAAYAFLASSDASYINGVTLRVDGAMKA